MVQEQLSNELSTTRLGMMSSSCDYGSISSNDDTFHWNNNTRRTNRIRKRKQSIRSATPLLDRFKIELSSSYRPFSLLENPNVQGSGGPIVLDLQPTFAPVYPIGIPLLLRVLFLELTWTMFSGDYYTERQRGSNLLYFSHLTHLTMALTFVAQLLSTFLSFVACFCGRCCNSRKLIFYKSEGEEMGILVVATWLLYSICVPFGLIVTVAYWTLDYNGEKITCYDLYKHGILAFLLWIDGVVIGRIPIRLKQFQFPFICALLYLGWTLIFAYWDLDGGVIYSNLNWRGNQTRAVHVSTLVVGLVIPFIFGICWLGGLWWWDWTWQGKGRRCVQQRQDMFDEGSSVRVVI